MESKVYSNSRHATEHLERLPEIDEMTFHKMLRRIESELHGEAWLMNNHGSERWQRRSQNIRTINFKFQMSSLFRTGGLAGRLELTCMETQASECHFHTGGRMLSSLLSAA
jgi:hypothetical protein